MLKNPVTGEPPPSSLFPLQQKPISTFTPSSDAAEDSELSIFDAQKYFNESNSNDSRLINKRVSPTPERISDFSSLPRFSSASSSEYGRNYRTRSFHATPTASSEASWNSQTGLLSNPPGAIAVSIRNLNEKKKKSSSSATKWLLGRKCPCSGKKSVQVKLTEPATRSRLNHKSDQRINLERQIIPDCAVTDQWLQRQQVLPISHKIIPTDDNRFATSISHHRVLATPVTATARPFPDSTNGFTFPILNKTIATTTSSPAASSFSPIKFAPPPPLEDPPRDSLEVFRPPDDPITTHTTAEHQRRQSFTFPASPKSRMTVTEDDMASDASSDLFEIESFSTTQTTSYQMYNPRRDSMDEAAIFHARRLRHSLDECYEPSEVSIDWSVTTAEGFDKISVNNFSEIDEMMTAARHRETEMIGWKRRGGGGGGLLSCRCEKAVSVGPPPVKCSTTEGQKGENSTMKHVSSRPGIANKPPLARSHSARLSLPFAT